MSQELNFSQKLKQGQKLAMNLQMQQSIALLQKNQEELTDFVMEKANENPLLEVVRTIGPVPESGSSAGTGTDFQTVPDQYTSLFEYLIDQVHLNYRDTPIRRAMLFLVEYIDSNGYLAMTTAEAMEKTGADYLVVLDALTLLQQLDPAGIGARNLQECLMLQTERDPEAPTLTYVILEECFEQLASRLWNEIATRYKITLADVQQIMDYVQTLSPAPGAHFGQIERLFIIPEIEVQVKNGELNLTYLQTGLPKLKFQENYFNQMSKVDDPEVQEYLKEKKQEFQWLKKTLDQRKNTIFEVGQAIIDYQADFFLKKEHPLKPLTLKMIAQKVNLHESTISRTVNGKYLKTDFGIFELRTFFASAIAGQSTSNQEIKKRLIELIQQEDKTHPHADDKLAELFADEEVKISRRTVAKYREQLGIPTSSKRKRYETKA
ncbi:RNA polymerase factor sigma-54 [Enterococcus timonensis]|uniref:RNA polymerase factor sigma-54 n=1 Tax=Enterococcus timonensis TaxID=1852364 RepID=UPI0008DA087B|nr:RNA polymerase factor sigma-54 [Enterococcus timonensis]